MSPVKKYPLSYERHLTTQGLVDASLDATALEFIENLPENHIHSGTYQVVKQAVSVQCQNENGGDFGFRI